MTQQDPFARPGRGVRRRHGRRRPDTELPGSTPRMRLRGRRRLAAMESALTRDTPQLASMFNVFNQLTRGEQPRGPERVLAPARRRLRPAHVAVLVTLTAVVALCLALSTQIRPATRQCTSTATAAVTAEAANAAVRALDCAAYPTNR